MKQSFLLNLKLAISASMADQGATGILCSLAPIARQKSVWPALVWLILGFGRCSCRQPFLPIELLSQALPFHYHKGWRNKPQGLLDYIPFGSLWQIKSYQQIEISGKFLKSQHKINYLLMLIRCYDKPHFFLFSSFH